jgi:Protein of unknown function (DUF2905)
MRIWDCRFPTKGSLGFSDLENFSPMLPFARMLIILGIILLIAGGVLYLLTKTGIPLGHLPGDIRLQTSNMTCVIALGTSIILSILLTLALNLLARFLNK